MPPGPLYNWLAIAHSVVDILEHAAQLRCQQLAQAGSSLGKTRHNEKGRGQGVETEGEIVNSTRLVVPDTLHRVDEDWRRQLSLRSSLLPAVTSSDSAAREVLTPGGLASK